MRCEIGVGLDEILTEGGIDRDLFADAVDRWGVPHVSVIDADYVYVTANELTSLGLGSGVKASLLAVAFGLEQRAYIGSIAADVAVVVDRDYEPLEVVSRFLFVTDGHSMESYALAEPALERFVTVGLGRGKRASGRGGQGPNHLHVSSGKELLDRILTPAIELAAIRLALQELVPPLAPFRGWTRYLMSDSGGFMRLKSQELIKNILGHHGRQSEQASVDARYVAAVTEVRGNPFLLVRGHDFVTILHQLLRSTWGRRIAGSNVKAWSEDRLSRMLLLALPPDTLDATGLFGSVKAQF